MTGVGGDKRYLAKIGRNEQFVDSSDIVKAAHHIIGKKGGVIRLSHNMLPLLKNCLAARQGIVNYEAFTRYSGIFINKTYSTKSDASNNIVFDVVDGVRIPFLLSGTYYKNLLAYDLARHSLV
ncbi:PREDICTED: uncharacterized protein LOC105566522 [Vollenhovia emeryi]|uniref:uncharacterized protein LOC105566522 n=1 Tax=Vollenhovia emeryi TaxID=411798 RepID=UPI0005F40B18|nr:PREDICTED: uncharacterized protein LOC105566522 [Vollenhovia emeryi]